MKSYLYLTKKYIRAYPKRCIGIVLCISLFIFAFLTILWYSDSYQYSLTENSRNKNGVYDVICFDADQSDIQAKKEELRQEGAALLSGLWKVESNNSDDIWIGDANENVSRILSLHLLSGEMPKSENEIAIEKSTFEIFGLKAEIGDSVELEIKNPDGSEEKKTFVLKGIIKDFSRKIQSLYGYQFGEIAVPSILTADPNTAPAYTHIFAASDSYLIRNMVCRYTYFNHSRTETASRSVVDNVILLPVKIFFVLTTIMGILSICIYFFKEQEQYLNLLRCIGLSKKRTGKLLLIQGFLMWLASLLIGTAGAVLALLLLQLISSFSSQFLFLNLNPVSLLAAALLGAVIIFISFGVLLIRFYRRAPLREAIYVSKRQRKSETKLRRCWHKAYGRRYRLQNATCVMIVLFCVGMSLFGPFVPLFNARNATFDNPDDFPDDSDYSLHMMGGAASPESYFINFPVGCGIPHEMADEILSDSRVRVVEAASSDLCTAFFLTSKNPENKLLYQYVVEAERQGENYMFEQERTDEMIRLAGGDSSTDGLVNLPLDWISYESVLYGINTFTDGSIDEKGYKSGTEIIAPDGLCSVGDEFTMVLPIADKETTEANIENHIKFQIVKLRVAATYPGSRLKMSTEYLFSVYPDLNYENVVIENLDHQDKEWTEELEENLAILESCSVAVRYDNYAKMAQEFYTQVNLEALQIIVSVLIYIVIILTAIVFSSYVQVRSNLRSYILMRAMGARIETVQKLIINEINHTLHIGIVSGAVCGGAVVGFVSLAFGAYTKLWDIYLFYVAPVFISTVILLYTGSRIAVRKAVHSMINRNIMEHLNTVE